MIILNSDSSYGNYAKTSNERRKIRAGQMCQSDRGIWDKFTARMIMRVKLIHSAFFGIGVADPLSHAKRAGLVYAVENNLFVRRRQYVSIILELLPCNQRGGTRSGTKAFAVGKIRGFEPMRKLRRSADANHDWVFAMIKRQSGALQGLIDIETRLLETLPELGENDKATVVSGNSFRRLITSPRRARGSLIDRHSRYMQPPGRSLSGRVKKHFFFFSLVSLHGARTGNR